MRRLDPVAERLVRPRSDAHAPPGAVLLIGEGGAVHEGAAGVADLDTGEPMTRRTVHDLASISKLLTTVAVMRLVAEEHLGLATTLGAVLGRRRAGSHRDRTVSELLQHRAGLWEWWPLYLPDGAPAVASGRPADPVGRTLALPPRYAPGSGRHYSDLGFQILGEVVAAVTDATFPAAVRALVLDPLGLETFSAGRGTGAVAASTDGDGIEQAMLATGDPYPVPVDATGFAWRVHTLRGETADGNAFHAYGGVTGHAGWFADAAGLLALGDALAVAGESHLWDSRTASAFAAAGPDPSQALGFRRYRVTWSGRERVLLGHPGFTGGLLAFSPATSADGEDALVTVVMTNRLHGRPAPGRDRLLPVEPLWHGALTAADTLLNGTG